MLNIVTDTILQYWTQGRKTKRASTGWVSGNAVCCTHNGESVDTRGRAGIHTNDNGLISWHCFNCGYKASYRPGRHLSYPMRKLLAWMGASDGDIKRLVIEALRIKELTNPEEIPSSEPEEKIAFALRALPENTVSLGDLIKQFNLDSWQESQQFNNAMQYLVDRKIDIQKYEFYLTTTTASNLHKRIIIPCYWDQQIIGYTSRAFAAEVKPKYYSQYEANYVFNIQNQNPNWKIVIICEGPFDAMSIDGVAILGNEVSEAQAEIIDRLGKEVVVVADADKAGSKLIKSALKYGWSVSYPVWQENNSCKDINEAIVKYGKLFTLKAIVDSIESNKLKIELKQKMNN